jgi:nucleotide-binding universal stress UspA family protein
MRGEVMKKVMIAIDDSDGSLRAVEHVARQFGGMRDLQVTLFHVLLGEPPQFWDDGHLLTEEEKKARKAVIETWLSHQKSRLDPIFQKATEALTREEITRDQIVTKFISDSIDVIPQCILAEAKAGGYQTVFIGRCGRSRTKHFLLGSIANQVVNAAEGIAVCVVG